MNSNDTGAGRMFRPKILHDTYLVHFRVFNPEGKMPLEQVADEDDNDRRYNLRNNSIDKQVFDQNFKQYIVQEKVGQKNKEIPE